MQRLIYLDKFVRIVEQRMKRLMFAVFCAWPVWGHPTTQPSIFNTLKYWFEEAQEQKGKNDSNFLDVIFFLWTMTWVICGLFRVWFMSSYWSDHWDKTYKLFPRYMVCHTIHLSPRHPFPPFSSTNTQTWGYFLSGSLAGLFSHPCALLMTLSLTHPAVLRIVSGTVVIREQRGGVVQHIPVQMPLTRLLPIWERRGVWRRLV